MSKRAAARVDPTARRLEAPSSSWVLRLQRGANLSSSFLCRENDITSVLDHTFCVEHNAFGKFSQHELKPNGRNLPVTEENKKEYVR